MFGRDTKEMCFFLLALALIMCVPTDAFAAFESLIESGKNIFEGLKSIIYPASAIGIICVCIGGFFGNINWKWLTAVFIGLIVIACCGLFIKMFTNEDGGITSASTLDGE